MSWLRHFRQPTQSYVVAFDIASSSQNYLNPNGLQLDRQGLFLAIDGTRLVRRCVEDDAVGGQFLGDEYRLAFPVTGKHGTISGTDVVEFVDEVFSTLESAAGYAPVVRAMLTTGPVEARELGQIGYLLGRVPFETLSRLSKSIGKQVNILVSDLDLRPMLDSANLAGSDLFVKRYSDRRIPDPFPGPPFNESCTPFILISVTNAMHQSDQGLIGLAQKVLNSLGPSLSELKVTVGPTSIVFAVEEAQFLKSKKLLAEIKQCALNENLSIAAAISPGVGRVIPPSRWTTESFESGTAIELCRITSELAPGRLAIPNRDSVIDLLAPLSRSLATQVKIPGKREEVFDARVSDSYFGNPAIVPPRVLDPVVAPDPPPVVRRVAPAVLSDEQWKQLEKLVPRITLSEPSKRSLMIKIARAAQSDPDSDPWAELQAIRGNNEFFTLLFHKLQRCKEPVLDDALIEGMHNLVVNQTDKEFLKRLMSR